MGVSINMHVHSIGTLLTEMKHYVDEHGGYREGALPVTEFFLRVADSFGRADDGEFISLWCEYYDDYNACYEFYKAVSEYYFPDRDEETGDIDIFWPSYKTIDGGANADEVLSDIFEDEFGYEGTLRSNDY